MTRAKAIKLFCIDCMGGSPYEVTLCGLMDCPLWEHRLGCGMRSDAYRKRVKGAWERGGERVNEARAEGQTLDSWLKKGSFIDKPARKSRNTAQDTGNRAESQKGGENV